MPLLPWQCVVLTCLVVAACSGGKEGAADADAVLPTLEFISKVFDDVQGTISTWCQPSRMGAAATVLRNMAVAAWYSVSAWNWELLLHSLRNCMDRKDGTHKRTYPP
jgi:hypothetical protein